MPSLWYRKCRGDGLAGETKRRGMLLGYWLGLVPPPCPYIQYHRIRENGALLLLSALLLEDFCTYTVHSKTRHGQRDLLTRHDSMRPVHHSIERCEIVEHADRTTTFSTAAAPMAEHKKFLQTGCRLTLSSACDEDIYCPNIGRSEALLLPSCLPRRPRSGRRRGEDLWPEQA